MTLFGSTPPIHFPSTSLSTRPNCFSVSPPLSNCFRHRSSITTIMRSIIRPQLFSRRCFTTSLRARSIPPSFRTAPGPQRLPKEEQEIFEELQRRSTGAFSTPRATPVVNQSPQSSSSTAEQTAGGDTFQISAEGEGEELHPDVRRGAQPEFEGDVNPKTGEVGGPKNEPLRWGAQGDWSFNGRVTDF
ncbi:uncharacterized protein IWZ02DRAFT_229897 [Phyllosticta citriasiana]|uniref:uncharacterized protein n=1 Tax=Phyllosticta citriasiana TaxID=595635 RepID=UPI0030FD4A4B